MYKDAHQNPQYIIVEENQLVFSFMMKTHMASDKANAFNGVLMILMITEATERNGHVSCNKLLATFSQ